jgi:carbon-monoxide dehydrogenase medium subunit
MIPTQFEYAAPATLDEALGLLANDGAKALAGGMSLVPMMKLRLAAPEKLVDLGRVSELRYIREDGVNVRIGAMATHHDIESSAVLAAKCPLLVKTASQIGDVQVRNMGTIGGSIAHADPAADWPAALLASGARVRIASKTGAREVAIEDFFVDTFTSDLQPGELVVEIVVPADAVGAKSAYVKVHQPASGFALVGIAVHKSNGATRIGVTGLAGKAYRAKKSESVAADPDKAAAVVADDVDANSDIHASAEFRKHLAAVHLKRALVSLA